MIEINSDILIIAVAAILGILVLKLLTKFIFRAIGLLLLIGGGFFYTYFYTDFFEKHKDNAIVQAVEERIDFISVFDYQKKNCLGELKTRHDSITCECIVEPIINDLIDRYDEDELKELQLNKKEYLEEMYDAVKRNQDEIVAKLKKRKAIDFWNKMVRNLNKGKFLEE